MSFRLVALDLDGTLLDSSGSVRPRVARAVAAAIESGCEVVLATGRRLQSVAPIAERLGVSTVILTDGTVVYDLRQGRAVFEETFADGPRRLAIELAHAGALPPVLFESAGGLGRVLAGPVEHDNPETSLFLSDRREVHRVEYHELREIQRVVGIVAMGDNDRVRQVAALAAAEAKHELIVWLPSTLGYHHHTVTFAPLGSSKGNALGWLARQRGITLADVMAVGDYENDVSLVSAAGWGVAMGNAVAAVRAVARAVVADNDHDGVAEAIERWVLD